MKKYNVEPKQILVDDFRVGMNRIIKETNDDVFMIERDKKIKSFQTPSNAA